VSRLLAVFLSLTLIACGSSRDDRTASGGSSAFVGKWTKNNCQDSGGFSNVTILEFTGTEMIAWDLNHDGNGCQSELFRRIMNTEKLSDISSSKFTRTSYQADTLNVVMTDAGVSKANSLKFCEISDWSVGIARDTRNKSCIWKFGSSSVAMGTAKEQDFEAKTTTNYFQVSNSELCFAEKPLSEASAVDKSCWKNVSE
jgi:hypothetical protein